MVSRPEDKDRKHDMQSKLHGICMLVTNMDAPTGGVQKNTRLLLSGYAGRGIATFACARNYYGLAKEEEWEGTQIHRSPVAGSSMALNGIIYLADTFWWLIRNRKKYDVIHCQQMFGPAMAAAVASYFIRKPIVTRITTVGELGEVGEIRRMPLAWLRLRLIRRVTRWVALTQEMKAELETLGIPSGRISIIYNSTEIPDFAAYSNESRTLRPSLKLDERQKTAVFVGRLSAEKNIDVLINAWKLVIVRYADAQLLLLGEGGDFRNVEADLRDLVKGLSLQKNVHFLGHVDNAKDYVLASDAFVLPTRTEGMSNSLVEAFACGAAIVATDIPANREICEHDVNSLLVPVGNARSLANAIIELFDSPKMAKEFGEAARQKAETELSIDEMISAYLKTYSDAIEVTRQ